MSDIIGTGKQRWEVTLISGVRPKGSTFEGEYIIGVDRVDAECCEVTQRGDLVFYENHRKDSVVCYYARSAWRRVVKCKER